MLSDEILMTEYSGVVVKRLHGSKCVAQGVHVRFSLLDKCVHVRFSNLCNINMLYQHILYHFLPLP
jgi:hypothetical protein